MQAVCPLSVVLSCAAAWFLCCNWSAWGMFSVFCTVVVFGLFSWAQASWLTWPFGFFPLHDGWWIQRQAVMSSSLLFFFLRGFDYVCLLFGSQVWHFGEAEPAWQSLLICARVQYLLLEWLDHFFQNISILLALAGFKNIIWKNCPKEVVKSLNSTLMNANIRNIPGLHSSWEQFTGQVSTALWGRYYNWIRKGCKIFMSLCD